MKDNFSDKLLDKTLLHGADSYVSDSACACNPQSKFDGVLRVMSYNMRFERRDKPLDFPNNWSNRKQGIVKSILDYNVTIFGTQELQPWQNDELLVGLGDKWNSVGEKYSPGDSENNNIFYRNDIYDCVEHNTVWLSETPNVQASKSWDSAYPRILTFGRFKIKTGGQEFFFFNTHLDHKSSKAQLNGLQIAVRYLDAYSEYPRILTGDFNLFLDSENFVPLKCRQDTYLDSFAPFAKKFETNGKTFHGYKGGTEGKPIDFIFYSVGDFELLSTDIIYDRYGKYWLSDHYPVYSQFKIV